MPAVRRRSPTSGFRYGARLSGRQGSPSSFVAPLIRVDFRPVDRGLPPATVLGHLGSSDGHVEDVFTLDAIRLDLIGETTK
jgi:hypothetical protein